MRQANKAVQRERFPIPNVEDTLYQMNGATVFSKLYLTQSFYQVELEESSRYITTFDGVGPSTFSISSISSSCFICSSTCFLILNGILRTGWATG
jgi:hypothetical protein